MVAAAYTAWNCRPPASPTNNMWLLFRANRRAILAVCSSNSFVIGASMIKLSESVFTNSLERNKTSTLLLLAVAVPIRNCCWVYFKWRRVCLSYGIGVLTILTANGNLFLYFIKPFIVLECLQFHIVFGWFRDEINFLKWKKFFGGHVIFEGTNFMRERSHF